MISIAITGGIGSGKSTVTEYLQKLGYYVIDADKMSREITSPGGKSIPYIRDKFGDEYINPDGSMNRVAMRDLVFHDPEALKLLEEGTTKVVIEDIEAIKKYLIAQGKELLFFDIPLLFEKHCEKNYDKIWVVTADSNIRLKRIMNRDGISADVASLMIDSQDEEERKTSMADAVLYNNTTIEDLLWRVDQLLRELHDEILDLNESKKYF